MAGYLLLSTDTTSPALYQYNSLYNNQNQWEHLCKEYANVFEALDMLQGYKIKHCIDFFNLLTLIKHHC